MRKRIEVGVLGATGMVGQQFINQLAGHPWFELTWLAASERSEGKRYTDAAPWRLETPIPEGIADRTVEPATPGVGPRLVFSALDAGVAGELERAFADAGHLVVSNARNHRMDPTVPLLVPEVNADHLALLRAQAKLRGGRGAIVTNPNCSTVVLTMALAPLRPFGLRSCLVSTMQAVSGAGYPGVASLDILGNVIPFISGEEEKIETRDAEDPRLARGRGGRDAPGRGQRAHEPGARRRRSHRDRGGGARAEAVRSPSCAPPSRVSPAPPSASACRRRRSGRSSTSTSRTVPSPASTRGAAAA